MFCKHNWDLLSEVQTESPIEQLARLGLKTSVFSEYLTNRKLVHVLTCKKCGALKKLETDIS